MRLSDRLELVVSFVEPAGTAADVGTDHGYVPMELVRRGVVGHALAMDVRKGPLLKAKEHIRRAGLENKIEARLSDGLSGLSPKEADAVVIAGMGGELMIHILEQGRHMWDSVDQWVLSPHSELHKVRRWLFENRFPIVREAMISEDGKYYTVLDVRKRERDGAFSMNCAEDESGLVYGRYLIDHKNPALFNYLKEEEQKLLLLLDRLSPAAGSSKGAEKSFREVKQKLCRNREVQDEMQGDHGTAGNTGAC